MIAIDEALNALPHYDRFRSVAELHALADELRADPRFTVEVAGISAGGRPIHHVRFGQGRVKALFVSLLHCCEPIGSLTVHGLISLLKADHPAVTGADVEWHFIPCADPDGALLNEDWSQHPFSLESYLKGFYNQEQADQIDGSFPFEFKKISFSQPTQEASVLRGLLDDLRPDFFFSLHNALIGGAFFGVLQDIGSDRYAAFKELLARNGIPLQSKMYQASFFKQFGEGVLQLGLMSQIYTMMESSGVPPENFLKGGVSSYEHLIRIKPEAQTLVVELPYVSHPLSESEVTTGQNLRQIKLRIDAENKYIAAATLEEWDRVKDDLDPTSPLYRKVLKSTVEPRDALHEGLPNWPLQTRDILINPAYNRIATERERFEEHVISFWSLCQAYAIVRLLKVSPRTEVVRSALARLEPIFDQALANIVAHLDIGRMRLVEHDKLLRAQLGSGFITLNALLSKVPALA